MLSRLRRMISRNLLLRSIQRHGTRIGWRQAPAYTAYWRRARKNWHATTEIPANIDLAVKEYASDRVTSFTTDTSRRIAASIAAKLDAKQSAGEPIWGNAPPGESNALYNGNLINDFPELIELISGPIGQFLEAYYRSWYKLYFARCYRSVYIDSGPAGSGIWHSDGGPGTCINVMFYLDPTSAENGALKVLRWQKSLELYEREINELQKGAAGEKYLSMPKDERRKVLNRWYDETIAKYYPNDVVQPCGGAGLIIPFANNSIHRGGYPDPGFARRAIVFHFYPSDRPIDLAAIAKRGIEKTSPYPKDPAAVF